MEFDDYVLQPDIQVRWSSKMAGRGRQMAIIDNPTWLKEKKDRGGKSTSGTCAQCHETKPTGL
jgi:cytochrome c553